MLGKETCGGVLGQCVGQYSSEVQQPSCPGAGLMEPQTSSDQHIRPLPTAMPVIHRFGVRVVSIPELVSSMRAAAAGGPRPRH